MVFFTFDSETYTWNETYITGQKIPFRYAYLLKYDNGKIIKSWRITEISNLFNILLNQYYLMNRKSFRIYIHNLGFDAKYFYDYMSKNFIFTLVYNQSELKINVFKVIKGKRKFVFEFRDSIILFYHLSIAKIGEIVGKPKLDCLYDSPEITEEMWKYCYRDNEILFLGLQKLKEMFEEFGLIIDIEQFNLTLPALSFKLFLLKNQKYSYKDECGRIRNRILCYDEFKNEFFKKFYFGGRTEVFDYNFYDIVLYLDFNSLYPSICVSYLFPIPPYNRIPTTEEIPIKEVFGYLCEVDESDCEYPFIPERINEKILFLARVKTHFLFNEELEYCKEQKIPFKIIEGWMCGEWVDCFSYFRDIYKSRMIDVQNKNPMGKLKKLPLNSTYGKFAEKEEKTETKIYPISILDPKNSKEFKHLNDKAKSVKHLSDGSTIFVFNKISTFTHNNFVIANRITALSRLKLVKYIQLFKKMGIPVIYSDTDSLVINAIYKNLVEKYLSDELGMLKIEETYYNFQAFAPKEYIFDKVEEEIAGMNIFSCLQKAKGISNKDIIDYILNGVNIIRPSRFNECVVRKLDFECAINTLKQKSTFYTKRQILSDGTTIPYTDVKQIKEEKEIILKYVKDYYKKSIRNHDKILVSDCDISLVQNI